jgi:predicted ATP-dependent endonuclease of OLD family
MRIDKAGCKTQRMDLREITVTNFRPFESASVKLPGHGLVLLAGANNAGKTAFLSAVDVMAGIASETQSLVRTGSRDPSTVAATFDLDESERRQLFHFSSRVPELLAKGVATQLKLAFEIRPEATPIWLM